MRENYDNICAISKITRGGRSFFTFVFVSNLGDDQRLRRPRWPSRQRSRRSGCDRGDRGWCAALPWIWSQPGRRRPPGRCRKRNGSLGTSCSRRKKKEITIGYVRSKDGGKELEWGAADSPRSLDLKDTTREADSSTVSPICAIFFCKCYCTLPNHD